MFQNKKKKDAKKDNNEDDGKPSWMDESNDHKHKQETEPLLFGTGKLHLHDPPSPEAEDDVETGGGGTLENLAAEDRME